MGNKKRDKHESAAHVLSSALMNHETVLLLSRGDFHLIAMDRIHNPLNKYLTQNCVAVIYMPGFSKEELYVRNHIPATRYIVALANPFTGNWVNGKPSLPSMWGILKREGSRRGSMLGNMLQFCLAVYDLLFTLGEYRYIKR